MLDAGNLLELALDEKNGITQALTDHQRHVGYVEFIGEATLNGMTYAIMSALTGHRAHVWGHLTLLRMATVERASAWK
ncbi:MAG: hypothetical protein R3E08_05180 [Thiotrichaceae bacterium]